MTVMSLKAPRIFDYLDLGLYMKDYYSYRKKVDLGFSYETWAAELEFNSRSFLRMMVVGKKKMTPRVVEALQRRNFATKDEQDYFFFLAKYTQAGSSKEKQLYSQKMMHLLRRQNHSLAIEDSNDFLSDPLLPRLLSLFSYEDVQKTMTSFARILGVSESHVATALCILEKLELIEELEESGKWVSKVIIFKVPDNKGSLNLRKFHEKSLQEALQAFDLPKATRSYKSLLLPMSEEEFSLFLQSLDEFSSEQMSRHNPRTYRGKRLFQINFNVYPVADPLREYLEEA